MEEDEDRDLVEEESEGEVMEEEEDREVMGEEKGDLEWLVKEYEGGITEIVSVVLDGNQHSRAGWGHRGCQSRAGHSLLPLDESIGRSGPRLEVPAGVVPVVPRLLPSALPRLPHVGPLSTAEPLQQPRALLVWLREGNKAVTGPKVSGARLRQPPSA